MKELKDTIVGFAVEFVILLTVFGLGLYVLSLVLRMA